MSDSESSGWVAWVEGWRRGVRVQRQLRVPSVAWLPPPLFPSVAAPDASIQVLCLPSMRKRRRTRGGGGGGGGGGRNF